MSLKMDMKDMRKNEIKDKTLDLLLSFIEDILNRLESESLEDFARQYVPPTYF